MIHVILWNQLVSIDLGTTNSTGHMWLTNKVSCIDWNGSYLFPSTVIKDANGLHACDLPNPRSGPLVRNFKRLLGQTYEEYRKMNYDEGTFGCDVIRGSDGNPLFRLTDDCSLSPEEAAAEVIKHIMEHAKKRYAKVDTVIVTVPANYSSRQKKATLKAVELAGYKCFGLLPEPTAAALSYLLKQDMRRTSTFLVYDFGGGTFDVSLLEYRDNKIRILQTNGDIHLGGSDIDVKVMKEVIGDYETLSGSPLLQNNSRSIIRRAKLLLASKDAKEALGTQKYYTISLDGIFGDDIDEDYSSIEFTQDKLNGCTKNSVEQTWRIVDETIMMENKKRNDLQLGAFNIGNITGVILVGGSSKLPGVRDLINRFFKPTQIIDLDPYTSVGEGAFLHARNMSQAEGHITVQTALGCDIGLGVDTNMVYRLFPRFSNLPCSCFLTVNLDRENRNTLKTALFEGRMDVETMDATNCSLVRKITLPIPEGTVVHECILRCDLEEGYYFTITCLNPITRQALCDPMSVNF